jgi:hypothetical protein
MQGFPLARLDNDVEHTARKAFVFEVLAKFICEGLADEGCGFNVFDRRIKAYLDAMFADGLSALERLTVQTAREAVGMGPLPTKACEHVAFFKCCKVAKASHSQSQEYFSELRHLEGLDTKRCKERSCRTFSHNLTGAGCLSGAKDPIRDANTPPPAEHR